jgi:hypothetical protein
MQPVRSAYQPPASSTFLSELTSHQQPANITFLSQQTSTRHQPPAKRTGWWMGPAFRITRLCAVRVLLLRRTKAERCYLLNFPPSWIVGFFSFDEAY